MYCFKGTLFLWLFWPSFNGALAAGNSQYRAIINTYFSMTGSVISTFIFSAVFDGKRRLDMVLHSVCLLVIKLYCVYGCTYKVIPCFLIWFVFSVRGLLITIINSFMAFIVFRECWSCYCGFVIGACTECYFSWRRGCWINSQYDNWSVGSDVYWFYCWYYICCWLQVFVGKFILAIIFIYFLYSR